MDQVPDWSGACHCRGTRFRVRALIDHKRICNCSICHQRGALMFRVAEHQLQMLTPLTDLATYVWGTGTACDYFCKTCGILPFRRPRAATAQEIRQGATPFSGWAINLRCLDGLDPDSVADHKINGRALPLT